MTDEELIKYARIHSETPLALFSADHCRRLLTLAGIPLLETLQKSEGFHSIDRWDMTKILESIRKRRLEELKASIIEAAKAWHSVAIELKNAQRDENEETEDRLELARLDAADKIHQAVSALEAYENRSSM